jgi:hypothetical protein
MNPMRPTVRFPRLLAYLSLLLVVIVTLALYPPTTPPAARRHHEPASIRLCDHIDSRTDKEDGPARALLVKYSQNNPHLSGDGLRRLACFSAYGKELHVFHAPYWEGQLDLPGGAAVRDHLPKHKLGYVIMAHSRNALAQLVSLITLLNDGDAFILVHIDARQDDLYSDLQFRMRDVKNVYLTPHRKGGRWGHASLVFLQLSAMWELIATADVDYVINLSAHDYPLARNRDVHAELSKITNDSGRDIFIETSTRHRSDVERRFRSSWVPRADGRDIGRVQGADWRPLPAGLRREDVIKHHQWLSISPSALRYLGSEAWPLRLLAYAEFSFIPDESYFATTLLASPLKNRVYQRNFRYVRFNGGAHPVTLTLADKDRFAPPTTPGGNRYHFIRKLEGGRTPLMRWIDANHLRPAGPCTMDQAGWKTGCLRMHLLARGHQVNASVQVHGAEPPPPPGAVVWARDIEEHDHAMAAGKGYLSVHFYRDASEEDITRLFASEGFQVKLVRQ